MIGPWRVARMVSGHAAAALDLDGVLSDGHSHPLAIDLVLIGVSRVDLLDVQVLHVGVDVGEAPGDAVVVADDHARHAGEGVAGHLVGAGVAESGWQCRAISYQMDGIWMDRCGSLASSGMPVVVRLPAMTQLFEPRPSEVAAELGVDRAHLLVQRFRAAGAGGRVGHDDGMVAGVKRHVLIGLLGAEGLVQDGALDLIVQVAAQVPGHGLAPGQRVGRGPGSGW